MGYWPSNILQLTLILVPSLTIAGYIVNAATKKGLSKNSMFRELEPGLASNANWHLQFAFVSILIICVSIFLNYTLLGPALSAQDFAKAPLSAYLPFWVAKPLFAIWVMIHDITVAARAFGDALMFSRSYYGYHLFEYQFTRASPAVYAAMVILFPLAFMGLFAPVAARIVQQKATPEISFDRLFFSVHTALAVWLTIGLTCGMPDIPKPHKQELAQHPQSATNVANVEQLQQARVRLLDELKREVA